jgi:hypothetical protein
VGRLTGSYGYGGPEWRALDDFAPSALWLLLAEGARLGAAIGSAARDTVVGAWRPRLEATADGDGGIRLSASRSTMCRPHDVLGTVGTSGLRLRLIGKDVTSSRPDVRRLSDDDRA